MKEKVKQTSPFLPPIISVKQLKSQTVVGLLPPIGPIEINKDIQYDSREDRK